ncbi:hypothetical protein [Mesorhizobium sp. M0488]|uniref:hypothetical protein n=1 Tax=unclassified Mesorhizobium TaxID=325217 RepID=UPI0033368126
MAGFLQRNIARWNYIAEALNLPPGKLQVRRLFGALLRKPHLFVPSCDRAGGFRLKIPAHRRPPGNRVKRFHASCETNDWHASNCVRSYGMRRKLDDKLDCKACGTILMDIPENATESTPIHCSKCGAYLGEWGELQDDFYRQAHGTGAFDLNHGNILKK